MYYTISNGGGEEKLNQLSIAISFSQVEADISICLQKAGSLTLLVTLLLDQYCE